MKGSCHCGRVTIEVARRPDYLNQCNCTLCVKLAGLWAYYSQAEVEIVGETRAYRRADMDPPMLGTHFCPDCGATTHWAPTEHFKADRTGINMRLFEPEELLGIEVRYGDKRGPDYDGERRYARAPTIFGETGLTA